MQDLSKIDWSKCKLPEWRGIHLRACLINGHALHIRDGVEQRKETYGAVANRNTPGDFCWEVTSCCPGSSFAQLDALKAICAQVDAFIETELRRMAEEWMTPGQALDWLIANPGKSLDGVHSEYRGDDPCVVSWTIEKGRPLANGGRASSISDALFSLNKFRTRAPKAEAKMPTEFTIFRQPVSRSGFNIARGTLRLVAAQVPSNNTFVAEIFGLAGPYLYRQKCDTIEQARDWLEAEAKRIADEMVRMAATPLTGQG